MTPLDFWLWGVVKEKVYGKKPGSVPELRQFIKKEIAALGPNIIVHITESLCGRYERLQENGGRKLTFFMLRVVFCVEMLPNPSRSF